MIDPRAIVDPGARIAANVEIGPFSIIGPDVEIGEGTVIGPHVIVRGPTTIGKNNRIFQFSSIGEECQDKKYAGEPTTLVIGDNNVIREACTFHRGTVQDNGTTIVGSNNLFMVNVHVAHDAVIGDNCILANDTNVAGHVKIGDWAILGGATQVHQFCLIGAHSMCGAGTVVLKDIPAYVMALGYPATPHGINSEGLKRRGFSKESIKLIRSAYKTLYRQGLTLAEALEVLVPQAEQDDGVRQLVESLQAASRGIIR
ncbi:MAG: acyl-[acyl-carrier-protein]--UDP-N-acetylglucosamine O-acyltransferase [Thalassobium sp.]|jgi:UDP-N-acetylglucosamine acyltransferase|uniref:Acyl-[acyl-carrier-protein]--UDP-N-acetylglucosamine O-acyltransferase n=1 Tax=Thalassolituus pacificus TaxID=2975440 RepID=A0A9X2WDD3_9GAMM|nr:acyl-ACP--UDP-N-acetylglucosamine O-acyltransferase [Thalassolituus pacificus]MCT7358344.1 acyl-ACP--UDP-N-acetylglucosamine O-acyltransferase [Thalassolituus pacificus]PHS64582.1 MAG: acyl-[acyl-carrier-protein]--UDP-N-acetylglucosamine O-acyltransferase [Thalassobium sp.]